MRRIPQFGIAYFIASNNLHAYIAVLWFALCLLTENYLYFLVSSSIPQLDFNLIIAFGLSVVKVFVMCLLLLKNNNMHALNVAIVPAHWP